MKPSKTYISNFKKVSEYDEEMPHSQTTDQPIASRGIDTEH